MNPETALLIFPLALALALITLLALCLPPRLGFPRLVLRIGWVRPGAAKRAPRPAVTRTARPEPARLGDAVIRRPVSIPRDCELRLAKNLSAWRDRRGQLSPLINKEIAT